ncbi:Uncharacterised protein [uncultured archaeon]|nr:Uncharacterised protein [uncultured archaeon]
MMLDGNVWLVFNVALACVVRDTARVKELMILSFWAYDEFEWVIITEFGEMPNGVTMAPSPATVVTTDIVVVLSSCLE